MRGARAFPVALSPRSLLDDRLHPQEKEPEGQAHERDSEDDSGRSEDLVDLRLGNLGEEGELVHPESLWSSDAASFSLPDGRRSSRRRQRQWSSRRGSWPRRADGPRHAGLGRASRSRRAHSKSLGNHPFSRRRRLRLVGVGAKSLSLFLSRWVPPRVSLNGSPQRLALNSSKR